MSDPPADPVEAIKALYGATLRGKALDGTPIPQWGYFDREGVGVLLARIDHLEAEAAVLKARLAVFHDRLAAQSESLSRAEDALS